MYDFEVNNMTNFQSITNKWGKNLGKAIITFSTPEPPFHIRSEFNVKEIHPLHPLQSKPVRCNNCREWGHKDFKCRNKVRCMNCSDSHMTKNCRKDFRFTRFVCFNCKGNHTANHPICLAWNQYKHSIEVKNQDTLNDWEQRKKVHLASLTYPIHRSYPIRFMTSSKQEHMLSQSPFPKADRAYLNPKACPRHSHNRVN